MAFLFAGMVISTFPLILAAQPPQLPADITRVQQHLHTDEVRVAYHLTDSSVRVDACTKEAAFCAIQSVNPLFWSSLLTFREKLASADPRDISIPGEILYLYLIKPLQQFIAGRHRLIIVPGERLTGLPFEAFIVDDGFPVSGPSDSPHYLIHDFEVVYHGAAESWHDPAIIHTDDPSQPGDDSRFAFMGFSPGYNHNRSFTNLPGATHEVAEIGRLFRQKGLSALLLGGEPAAKKNFIANACRGRIVHLATHHIPGTSSGMEGGLLFCSGCPAGDLLQEQEGLLTMEELAAIRMEADLVVLSACSAGAGLRMTGARNVLSTLWNITDIQAMNFMLDFYRYWLSGKTYSEALREVKLQWINCRATALPTAWAPYVLTGR